MYLCNTSSHGQQTVTGPQLTSSGGANFSDYGAKQATIQTYSCNVKLSVWSVYVVWHGLCIAGCWGINDNSRAPHIVAVWSVCLVLHDSCVTGC